MAMVITDDAHYQSIADKIREKTESSDLMKPKEFAEKIDDVYAKGDSDGRSKGQEDVLARLTNNYTRQDYSFAFQYTNLSGLTFEKTVAGTNFTYAFKEYKGASLPENMDFRNTNVGYTHVCRSASNLLVFPNLNIPIETKAYSGAWQFCTNLHTIEGIGCNENTTFDATFDGCRELVNVSFNGTIGQNILFNSSGKLSKESILGVFEHLSGTATGKAVTFKTDAIVSAFGSTDAAEWTNLVATKSNWTVTLV